MKIKPVLGILALIAFAVAAKSQTVETVVTNGLFEPYGVAVDLSTNIYYFTDSVNHRIVKYDPAAVSLTTLITFIGETNNFVGSPAGIAVARGGLIVSDSFNHAIYRIGLDGSGSVLAGGGRGLVNGPGATAQFSAPAGLAADASSGNIYIADSKNNAIRRLAPDNTVTTYASGFFEPAAVAVGDNGRVFVADTRNQVIKVIETNGSVSVVVGKLGVSGADDGTSAGATLNGPRGLIWLGGDTGLLVADSGNDIIRRVYLKNGVWQIVTFAGSAGSVGLVDGPLLSARFNSPIGLALDLEGSVLVADLYNNALRSIKRAVLPLPTVLPSAGSFSNTITVTITSAVSNSVFYYSTNGSDPNPFSAVANGPLTFTGGPVPLKVRAFSPDFATSATVSNNYAFFVNPLSVSVSGGSFDNDVDLTISTLTSGAVIRYTTDGSQPTTNSPVWTDRTFGLTSQLQVRAFRDGFDPTPIVNNTFTFTVNQPLIQPGGLATNDTVAITLSSDTKGAELFWTIDGTSPTTNSFRYSSPFILGTNGTLKVRGFKNGYLNSQIANAVFNLAVGNPVVVPSGLTTNNTVVVSLISATPQARLYWTLDGTVPSPANGFLYTSPFVLGTNGTLQVKGFRNGFTDSQTINNNFNLTVANPVILPAGVTTNNTVNVTLASLTAGAQLYWTIDGREPSSTSGFLYTSPFVLGTNGTLQVKAFKNGFIDSQSVSNNFNLTVANPVITPAGVTTNNTVKVMLTSATAGAQLYWTLDGTDPSPSNGFLYTSPFVLGTNGTLQVKGFKNGFVSSQTISDNFSLTVASPVISPAGAITNNTVKVTLTSATAGAQLYWTLDGTDPSPSNGFLYTSSFVLGTNGTLQVKGVKNGFIDSQIVSNNFSLTVASPVISPAGATTNNTVNVTLTSLTAGSQLYWTINGTEPAPTNGFLYTGSFVLGTNGTLQVKGVKNGFIDSQTVSNNFNLIVANPVISPAGAITNNTVNVTLTSLTAGARLYWTIDGTVPSPTDGILYTNTFVLATNGTLQVKGFKNGFIDSQTISNNFNLAVANPVISPAGATTNNTVNVTLTSLTAGSQLYWTINGTEPAPTNGFLYTGSFVLGTNGTLQVKGVKNGFIDSQTVSNNFNLIVANPVISPAGAITNNTVNVTLTSLTAGARLYWTIDGTVPSPTDGILYTNTFVLATNGTLQVKGFKNGFIDSQTISNNFNLAVANPVISPAGATTNNTVNVTLTSLTAGSQLYWTINGTEPATTNGFLYTSSFVLGTNGTLQVKGFKNGFSDSQTVSNNFNLTVANPVISPAGSTTNNTVNVTLTSLTAGARLYWTIDGTEPSPTNGILYSAAFMLGTNGTLQVKGFKNGFIDSQSVSNTFNLVVANPVITPGSGTSINSVQILFSSPTTSLTYYFTSDGTEPTTNSTRYSGSLTLVTNTQLKVVGLRDGFARSATVSSNYFIQVDKPTMSPSAGFFPNGTTVTLTVARADAKIYYTLNGQDPTPNDQLYTGPFTLNQVFNQGSDLRVVKARAFAPNTLPSDIVSGQPVDTNSIGIPRDVVGGVGATIVVPLVVNLQTNQVLRSLQFRFEVFPNSPTTSSIPFDLRALAITGNDFVQVVGPSQGSSPAQLNASTYRSGSTNGLVVSAIGTNANFVIRDFGTVALLAITIPPTANVDDSYTIQVVQASGTSDGQQSPVRLAPMGSRMVTVKNISYVVGDSAPGTWYNAGDFGDGNLDNSDVNNAFYASLGIRVPYAFTDVFDAMDAFPDDTNGAVGGDGQIRFLDWQRILNRSLRRDGNNWRRSWAGGGFRVANTVALNGSPNTPAQTLSNLLNGVVWLRQARLGAFSLENINPNGTVDVPVYVDVKPGYSLAGLQFRIAVESDGPALEQPAQFSSAPGLPQPISVDGLPPNQVVGAWPLVPSPSFNPALQGSNLLGHVRFTIPATARPSQCYTVRFLTTDGSPDDNTQYDLESVPGCVWVQSGALKLADGISDEWKTNFFGSVSNTLGDADADPDGDGVTNGQEFLAGTSPAKLLLHIADISPNAASGSGVRLRWFAAPGQHYVLECSSDLAGTNWRVVADNLAGQGDIKEFIDTNRTHAAQFYRVRVKP